MVSVGGLAQAQADNRYLKKTDPTTTYETQTSASNTYLSKTDATSTYAPVGASWTKAESDAKYATSASGGLSSNQNLMFLAKIIQPLPSSFARKNYNKLSQTTVDVDKRNMF